MWAEEWRNEYANYTNSLMLCWWPSVLMIFAPDEGDKSERHKVLLIFKHKTPLYDEHGNIIVI